jgi:hypothetical protein
MNGKLDPMKREPPAAATEGAMAGAIAAAGIGAISSRRLWTERGSAGFESPSGTQKWPISVCREGDLCAKVG